MKSRSLHKRILPLTITMSTLPAAALAADGAAEITGAAATYVANNTWMLVATFLVFIMHLGFASLEAGLTRAKNTVNILFKNTAIIAIGLLTYAAMGFNLMYPGDFSISGFFGFSGFGIGVSPENMMIAGDDGVGIYTYWTDFIFQAMFAATAATIVSGAVAERIKLHSFLIFSTVYVALIYPWVGSWKWGGGWLDAMGFYDFAGSTLVHSVGGWAALAGVLVLGPRLGKYAGNKIKPIMGHSMPLAAIGVFLLWLGWFGFNGGSVLSADPAAVSFVFVTTSLAAAAGIMGAIFLSWILQKKPDLSMALNGALAGLVGITAGADVVSVMSSIVIGFIAGLLVVVSVMGIDRIKIDDPVGALSVHLVCGIWGTLAVGLFSSDHSFLTQIVGVVAYAVPCFFSALAIFYILKKTLGIRVDEEEEMGGLDVGEHGMAAYADFEIKSAI
ncbi:ammonium transporter [Desulfotignum phosphitoxidans]|uniref:Ammonium transporter n=1 Tax=Desulfotignum phosphitoxidans DSM 13687 TaxID=1286635 RepID=S0G181_9BACT|nr:ammonium transporter [Desulfotignum phosphitoxidans]EMS77957.1 ammonium transporter [Desulfotignum phosphitoxidans DSM 13687]